MLTAAVLDALDFTVMSDIGFLKDEAGVFVVFCDPSGDRQITGKPLAIESAPMIRSHIRALARAWMAECQDGFLLFAIRLVADQSQREALAQKLKKLNQD